MIGVCTRWLVLSLVVLGSGSRVSAQEVNLSGRVMNHRGKPISGAIVRVIGLHASTVTRKDGTWQIQENSDKALFPKRLMGVIGHRFDFKWESGKIRIENSIDTNATVTIVSKGEKPVYLRRLVPKGRSLLDPFENGKPKTGDFLVGIRTDAGARASFWVSGGKAIRTFPAPNGTKSNRVDVLLVRYSGYEDRYIRLKSYTKRFKKKIAMRLIKGKKHIVKAGTNLRKFLPTVQGGDTVELESGTYPFVQLFEGYDKWVTIKPKGRAEVHIQKLSIISRAKTATRRLDGSSNFFIRFEGITFDDGAEIRGGRFVDFVNCTLKRAGQCHSGIQYVYRAGLMCARVGEIRVEDCEVTNTGFGLTFSGHDLVIRNNHIHHIGHDGLVFTNGQHILVEGNRVHNMDDGYSDRENRSQSVHADCVHIFTNGEERPWGWITDLTFRNNSFYHGESMSFMIQCKRPLQFQRLVFENNLIGPSGGYMIHYKAWCQGLIFRHNSILDMPNDSYKGISGRTIKCNSYSFAMPANFNDTTDVQIYGNIFTAKGRFEYFLASNDKALTRCENNIFYMPGGGSRMVGKGSKIVKTSPFAKPGDPTGDIKPGSSADNAGAHMDKAPLTFDRYWQKRGSQPDIGAVERQ